MKKAAAWALGRAGRAERPANASQAGLAGEQGGASTFWALVPRGFPALAPSITQSLSPLQRVPEAGPAHWTHRDVGCSPDLV